MSLPSEVRGTTKKTGDGLHSLLKEEQAGVCQKIPLGWIKGLICLHGGEMWRWQSGYEFCSPCLPVWWHGRQKIVPTLNCSQPCLLIIPSHWFVSWTMTKQRDVLFHYSARFELLCIHVKHPQAGEGGYLLGGFGFQGESCISFDLWCLPPFCLFHVSLWALQKVMGLCASADLHSGHGSIHCSPRRSRRRSGWGFQIQHLPEQTGI